MTIELHINGVRYRVWEIDEIREGWTEEGGKRWNQKLRKLVNVLKQEVWEVMEFNEWEFFVVYPSAVNNYFITVHSWQCFERQVNGKQVDRIVKKYGKVV